MSELSPAQQAIAAAQAAAAQHATQQPAGVTTVPAVQSTGTAVGAPVKAGPAFTMDTIGAGQMSVDEWVKVTEDGLKIGDKAGLVEKIQVEIDMRDGVGFTVKLGIKGGNPAQYAYTLDGAVANDGKPWDMAMARIRGLSPSANPYRCVDLPMVVLEEVKNLKNELMLEAGKTLGYTTSTTNWANWEVLYREVAAQGLMGKKVKVELTSQPRKNKNGNIWGVIAFKLIGESFPDEAAD